MLSRKNMILNGTALSLLLLVNSMALADTSNIYRVSDVGQNGILNLRAAPSSSAKVLLEIPHNARWITIRASSGHGRSTTRGWQKISWNNQEGWVDGNYLAPDPEATQVKLERMSCLQSNPKLPACCGYPQQKFTGKLYPVKVYNVRRVDSGASLNVRKRPGRNAAVVETIPHNAVGIVKFPNQVVKNGSSTWEKVRWNGQNGWVNSYYLEYDPELSASREQLREMCGVKRSI